MLRYKVNIRNNNGSGVNIPLPLTNDIDPTLRKNELTTEKYFDRVKENLVPSIVDMEKVVLYPAIKNGDEFMLADEIEMNFHFRKRIDNEGRNPSWEVTEGWSIIEDAEWNDKFYKDQMDDDHGDTYPLDKVDNISDLVGFMGFTNDDIKYQRNRVKQSFFRLMYYDSDGVLGKNMLTYSTSFLDINKLYSKYSTMIGNEEFISYYNGSQTLVSNDAIPNSFTCFEPSAIDEKYDSLRLSSRLTLKSRDYTDASSDGFYLYLFKEDAPSYEPQRMYLRTEFNNAGYGKTINLTMPLKENDGTYETIKRADADFPTNYHTTAFDDKGNKFDFEKFQRDSYIPVECIYYKPLKKFIYYFPIEGDVNNVADKKITLNFWEPKLN